MAQIHSIFLHFLSKDYKTIESEDLILLNAAFLGSAAV